MALIKAFGNAAMQHGQSCMIYIHRENVDGLKIDYGANCMRALCEIIN